MGQLSITSRYAYDVADRLTSTSHADASQSLNETASYTYLNNDQLSAVDYNYQIDHAYTYDNNNCMLHSA